jgi:hypothetical protein
MRTSVDIPDVLFRRARKLARETGRTFRDLVIDGLRAMLEAKRTGAGYEMKDCSFGEDGLVEGLSWSDWERMRDLTYGDGGS